MLRLRLDLILEFIFTLIDHTLDRPGIAVPKVYIQRRGNSIVVFVQQCETSRRS